MSYYFHGFRTSLDEHTDLMELSHVHLECKEGKDCETECCQEHDFEQLDHCIEECVDNHSKACEAFKEHDLNANKLLQLRH